MMRTKNLFILMAIMCSVGGVASADPVKIGMITTLTTKAGYLGEEIRDGFRLAMEQGGGKLGGVEIELLVEDDGRKPERGKQIAERYIKRENVKIITGIEQNIVPTELYGPTKVTRAKVVQQEVCGTRGTKSTTIKIVNTGVVGNLV